MTHIKRSDGLHVAAIDTRGAYVNVEWIWQSHEPLEPDLAEELARAILAAAAIARRTRNRQIAETRR